MRTTVKPIIAYCVAKQSGQTLIETLVAIFVLIMGITAAVGLAVFALNSSTNITQQIVGLGLAREGVEAVKNMRDTNWLKQPAIDSNCYNYASSPVGQLNAKCYKGWLDQSSNGGYNIDPGAGSAVYKLGISPGNTWQLQGGGNGRLGLNLETDTADPNFVAYYTSTNVFTGTSNFYRRIIITKETAVSPYNQSDMARIKVVSQVWWRGKKCEPAVDSYIFDTAKQSCKVELTTYLTNWKNYQ